MSGKAYAVYVRVSTDKDEQISSIENQVDICRNWLERNGFDWSDRCVYKDEGISGTLFLERPAIQLILEKARQKEIDMAVFKSISRLARDLKDSLEIRETLLAHGVRIVSVEEGYDSAKASKNDLAFELWSLFAAQYSRTLSAGVSAALAAKVRRGEHIGKTPFGYFKLDGRLVIDTREADIVRQIFDWYSQGFGYKRITKELNQKRIRTKSGGQWQTTSVQRILKNPLYCGDFVLNQYGTIKIGGRKKQIKNPPEQWLYFRDHHPPIISREQFEQLHTGSRPQTEQTEQTEHTLPRQQSRPRTRCTPWNELRGLLKCGRCGANMVIVHTGKTDDKGTRLDYNYLKCSQYRRKAQAGCVNHSPLQYDELRRFLLQRLLRYGGDLPMQVQSDFAKQKAEDLQQLQKQLQQDSARKKGLLDLYLEQLIDRDEFETKRKELEAAIRQTKEKLALLQSLEEEHPDIRTVKQAILLLERREQDLRPFFQTLLRQVVIHADGTVDVEYEFAKGTHQERNEKAKRKRAFPGGC